MKIEFLKHEDDTFILYGVNSGHKYTAKRHNIILCDTPCSRLAQDCSGYRVTNVVEEYSINNSTICILKKYYPV